MNHSQLLELKVGDKIVCRHLPAFTDGKEYTVRMASVGRMVDDDRGVGRYLNRIEHLFERVDDDSKSLPDTRMEEETCHQDARGGQDVAARDIAGDGHPCVNRERHTAQGRVVW